MHIYTPEYTPFLDEVLVTIESLGKTYVLGMYDSEAEAEAACDAWFNDLDADSSTDPLDSLLELPCNLGNVPDLIIAARTEGEETIYICSGEYFYEETIITESELEKIVETHTGEWNVESGSHELMTSSEIETYLRQYMKDVDPRLLEILRQEGSLQDPRALLR